MLRPALAAGLLLALALAGCSGDGNGGGSTTSTSDEPAPPPEEDNGVFHVTFEADGEATLEVPFPSLDSCRTPEHWMGGDQTGNAQAVVREAADGRTGPVLALTGSGSVSWSSQIPPGDQCQTLRYDPWSTEPEAPDGTAEARVSAGTVGHAMVLVRLVRETCGNATLYEGTPGPGWTALPGRSLPVSCG